MATIGDSPAAAWDKFVGLMTTNPDKYAKVMKMQREEGRELSIFKTATGHWEVGFFHPKSSDDYRKKVYTDLTTAVMPSEVPRGQNDKYKVLRDIRNDARSKLVAILSKTNSAVSKTSPPFATKTVAARQSSPEPKKAGASVVAQPVQSKPITSAQYHQNQKKLREDVYKQLKEINPGKNQLVHTADGMATTPKGAKELEKQRKALHQLIVQLGTKDINEPVEAMGTTLLDIAKDNPWVGDEIIQDLVVRGARGRIY